MLQYINEQCECKPKTTLDYFFSLYTCCQPLVQDHRLGSDRQTGGCSRIMVQGIVYPPGSAPAALVCFPRTNCPQTSNLSYPCSPRHVGIWQEGGLDPFLSFTSTPHISHLMVFVL